MAGRGRAPKDAASRRNASSPLRGEWSASAGVGWQHGPVPDPPDGLMDTSREAWATWFGAWFAGHWAAHDLPGLRVLVCLYDEVARGGFHRAGEYRLWADLYGITPKGQQDRRWLPPTADVGSSRLPAGERRRRLRVVE